jgi:hypothetical protein
VLSTRSERDTSDGEPRVRPTASGLSAGCVRPPPPTSALGGLRRDGAGGPVEEPEGVVGGGGHRASVVGVLAYRYKYSTFLCPCQVFPDLTVSHLCGILIGVREVPYRKEPTHVLRIRRRHRPRWHHWCQPRRIQRSAQCGERVDEPAPAQVPLTGGATVSGLPT